MLTGVIGIPHHAVEAARQRGSYIFNWLVGYSALLGPIAGIMIVDYWLIRRTRLDVPDLYRTDGRYAGVNWVALCALGLGVAPNVPGFPA